MFADAIKRLQMKAFWEKHQQSDFKEALEKMQLLCKQLTTKCTEKASSLIKKLKTDKQVNDFLTKVDAFLEECSQVSEQCKYYNNFLKIMSRIQNLVRADRTGDFMLYIKTIRELLPIFLGCDGINYLKN